MFSTLIFNNHVVQNDTCTHDHTKYLVGKRTIWSTDNMEESLENLNALSTSFCAPSWYATNIRYFRVYGRVIIFTNTGHQGRWHRRSSALGCIHT